ncbi:hypothetical protein F01_420645 [Burkholderia cenocepacia]|nr:hypothetical protein F01_420645 [Burkholderia cenocepacia]
MSEDSSGNDVQRACARVSPPKARAATNAAAKTEKAGQLSLTGLWNSWWGVSDSNTRPTD